MKIFGRESIRFDFGFILLSVVVMSAISDAVFAAENAKDTGECLIPTARGDMVDPSTLGFTLPTQLIIQESPEMSINWPDTSWGANPEKNFEDVVSKLTAAHEMFGVDTIIDRTIPGIGRNVPRMQEIARQVPLNIIVTTGWYTLYELPYYFHYREHYPEMFEGFDDSPGLVDLMVRDIEEGIAGTGVRAAAIKVVSDKHGLHETPDVRAVFRAVARAHRRTGAPILTHSVGVQMGKLHQDVLLEDGVDLSRVVLGHMDRSRPDAPLSEFEELLKRGSFLSFDGWYKGDPTPAAPNPSSREMTLERIMALIERGYIDQILISGGPMPFTDAFPSNYRDADIYEPYSRLTVDIIPALKRMGLSDSQIFRITVENPRRALETLCKGGY